MHRKQIKRAAALVLALAMTAASSGLTSFAEAVTGEAGSDFVYVTLDANGGKFHITSEKPDVPVNTPPDADEPVNTPPDADEPVNTPPNADEPVNTPPNADENTPLNAREVRSGRAAENGVAESYATEIKLVVEASPDGKFYLFKDTINELLAAKGAELLPPDGEGYLDQPSWMTKKDDPASVLVWPEEGFELTESGLKLYAGWMKETVIPADSDLAGGRVTAMGLGAGQTLTVGKLADADRKGTADLAEALKSASEYANIDADKTLQVDMDVPGHTAGKKVSMNVELPDEFAAETIGKAIVVIHYGKSKIEIITPVYERDSLGAIRNIAFSLSDFSPVIIAAVDKMVEVTLENVTGGYGIVYNEVFDAASVGKKTYLPIGETVRVPEGTQLTMVSRGVHAKIAGFKIKEDGALIDTSAIYNYDRYTVAADQTVITPVFERREGSGSAGTDEEEPWAYAEDGHYDKPVKTSNSLYVEKGEHVVTATNWSLDSDDYDYYDNDLFTLSPEGVLASKDVLPLGRYDITVTFDYDGKTYEDSVFITVGNSISYYMYMGKVANNQYYDAFDYLGESSIKESGATFKEFQEDGADFMEPALYGGKYQFAGWYGNDAAKLKDEMKISYDISAYARFVSIDNPEQFYNPEIKTFDDAGTKPEEPDEPAKPNRPSSSGSSSSGGGSSRLTSNGNLTGTWEQDSKGWRFKQSDGTYAANKWGKINNLWYYFDADTYMHTGWLLWNNCWYYMNPEKGSSEGVMQIGWQFDKASGRWFCMSPSGIMLTGWQNVNDKWYYLNPVSDGTLGAMLANQWIGNQFVNADGVLVQ